MTTAARLQRILLWTAVALAGLLAVSGVWLTFEYRPNAAQAWSVESSEAPIQWPRLVHSLAAWFLFISSAVLVVVSALARQGWRLASGLLVSTILLTYTGLLLPWDQLALWAVTVGSHAEGMWLAAFSDEVRFVLIRGMEISQGTLRLWFIVHIGVLTVAFAAILTALVLTRNRDTRLRE